MQNDSHVTPDIKEIIDFYNSSRHKNLLTTTLDNPYKVNRKLRNSLAGFDFTSMYEDMRRLEAGALLLHDKTPGERSIDQSSNVVKLFSGKEDSFSKEQYDLSVTFVSEDFRQSSANDIFLEFALELSKVTGSVDIVSRAEKPDWLPEELHYRKVGLAAPIVSAIKPADLLISSSYTLLQEIKLTFDAPLVYFAYENTYLESDENLKERILLASALGCADLTVCFSNYAYKKLTQDYGVSALLMPFGINMDTFVPSAKRHPGMSASLKTAGRRVDTNGDAEVGKDGPEDNFDKDEDNFWHLQRKSLYRKNGTFGKNRFDFSYHFMMREENLDGDDKVSDYGISPGDSDFASEPGDMLPSGQNSDLSFGASDWETSKNNITDAQTTVLFVLDEVSDLYGADIAVKVIKDLNARNPELKIMVATWEETDIFSDNSEIRIISNSSDLINAYRDADIYVGVEKNGNYARHALEAMAMGLPVVSSDHYGIVDLARHGDNALLGPVADAGSILDLIRRVISDNVLTKRLQEGGFETANLKNWSFLISYYGKVFSSLLDIYRENHEDGGSGKAFLRSGEVTEWQRPRGPSKDKIVNAEIVVTTDKRYKVLLSAISPEIDLYLNELEFESEADVKALLLSFQAMNFTKLALPVSRQVIGDIRRVSWETVVSVKGAAKSGKEAVTYLYLPVLSQPVKFSKNVNPGLSQLEAGDYKQAFTLLMTSHKEGDENPKNILSPWVILSLMGLGRKEEATKLALSGCRSFIFNPDFYVLAYHLTKGSNLSLDYGVVREKVALLGCGASYGEWFANPLELLDKESLLPVR